MNHELWRFSQQAAFDPFYMVFNKIPFKVRSDLLQRTIMKTGIKTIPGAGHSPSTFVPTAGHLTA